MALRPILKYPDPRLRQVCKPVPDPSAQRALVQDMAETMYAAKGAGLAAIQVGEPVQLFIIESSVAGRGEEDPPLVFINPELVALSQETENAEEGCLSFPGIYVPIERSLRAKIRATDLEGRVFEMEGEELFARAMQHEYDHLNGKLLADYVGRIKRQLIARRLARSAAEDASKGSEG
jgi:peptide deformylase